MAYCCELPFGIMCFSSFINIEAMNIAPFDIKVNTISFNNTNCLLYYFLSNQQSAKIHKNNMILF